MLSKDQIEQYRRNGYALYAGFFCQSDVLSCLRDIEEISAGNTLSDHDKTRLEMEPKQPPTGTLVRRIYDPCTYYQRFRALAESSELLDCVQQLLGPNLVFHYSKINMKPPEVGSVVEWHQDLAYYPLTNPDSLAVLIYLDEADDSNGCLKVIPGGHRGPLMDHTLDGIFQGKITEIVDESQAIAIEGKPGAAIFLHGMTPHASTTNVSARPRRTLILSYRAADAFPIYCGDMTVKSESHVRRVRGAQTAVARLSLAAFPIPRYPAITASLYELQELSRHQDPKQS